jgi:hypothetical protein
MSFLPSLYRSVMRGVAYTLEETSVIHLSSTSSGQVVSGVMSASLRGHGTHVVGDSGQQLLLQERQEVPKMLGGYSLRLIVVVAGAAL